LSEQDEREYVGESALYQINHEMTVCTACSLHSNRTRTGVHTAIGNINAKLVVVMEAPTQKALLNEDILSDTNGDMLVSLIGRAMPITPELRAIQRIPNDTVYFDALKDYILDLVFFTSFVGCPLFRDAALNNAQVKACSTFLNRQLYAIDPTVIVAMGGPGSNKLFSQKGKSLVNRGKVKDFCVESPFSSAQVRYTGITTVTLTAIAMSGDFDSDVLDSGKGLANDVISDFKKAFDILEQVEVMYGK